MWYIFTRSAALRIIKLICLLSLFMFLVNLLAACGTNTETPPQVGAVFYTLTSHWEKPVHTLKDLANNSLTLVVEARRTSDGQQIWQTSLPFSGDNVSWNGATLLSAGTSLYILVSLSAQSKQKGQVIALDALNGQTRWQSTLDGSSIWNPTVMHGNLFLQVDKQVEALDGGSGNRLWSAPVDKGYSLRDMIVTSKGLYLGEEGEILTDGKPGAYFGTAMVRALNFSDGRELWRHMVMDIRANQLEMASYIRVQANEQQVYVIAVYTKMEIQGNIGESVPYSTLLALKAENGSEVWHNPTQRARENGSQFDLALNQQTLFVRDIVSPGKNNTLTAFQSQSGQLLWSWQTPLLLTPFMPPDHIFGNSLNQGQSFCALHASDGSIAWCGPYNQAGPVIFSQGKVWIVAFELDAHGQDLVGQPPRLFVLNERDGSQVAVYPVGDGQQSPFLSFALS